MLRAVAYALATLVMAKLACSLPVEEKTGCVTSEDCVEDRICDEGQCSSGACVATCEAACDRVAGCELAGRPGDCEATCASATGLLPAFDEHDCKAEWDLLVDDACEVGQCLLDCRDLCVFAETCRLIADVPACTIGCQQLAPNCSVTTPMDCADVPSAVQCYEAGACP